MSAAAPHPPTSNRMRASSLDVLCGVGLSIDSRRARQFNTMAVPRRRYPYPGRPRTLGACRVRPGSVSQTYCTAFIICETPAARPGCQPSGVVNSMDVAARSEFACRPALTSQRNLQTPHRIVTLLTRSRLPRVAGGLGGASPAGICTEMLQADRAMPGCQRSRRALTKMRRPKADTDT